MTITFPVSDVKPAKKLLDEVNYSKAIETQLGGSVESCAWQHKKLVPMKGNVFVQTVHQAYADHRPLVLSPDHIWLVLCQGLAAHISQHQEAFRHHFVQHEGQKVLNVERRDFRVGNPLNPWSEIVAEFGEKIKAYIGEQRDLITAEFSTTGDIEKMAYEITLMDAMSGYFVYAVTMCGIPSITLEGTTEDWEQIVQRVQAFRTFDLDWWVDHLEPILKEFVAASKGQVNTEFWQTLYKRKDASGGPFISGWIVKFFPYLFENHFIERGVYRIRRNEFKEYQLYGGESGMWVKTNHFPHSLSKAPVIVFDGKTEYHLDLIAGFMGARQDRKTKALRPEIGWAVKTANPQVQARQVSDEDWEYMGVPEHLREKFKQAFKDK